MERVKRAKDPVTRTVPYKCMDLDLRNHRRKFRCCLEAPLVVCSVVSHVWGLGREVWWDLISSKSVNYDFQIRASVQKHRFLIWIKKPFISTKHSRRGWSRRALKYIRSSWCVSCAVPKRLMSYCSRRFITTTCLRSCNSLPKATGVCVNSPAGLSSSSAECRRCQTSRLRCAWTNSGFLKIEEL